MSNYSTVEFSERLKKVRKEKGLTQEAFAEILGIKRTRFSQYELGNNYPQIEILAEIAAGLEVSIDWLVSGSDFQKAPANENAALIPETGAAIVGGDVPATEDAFSDMLQSLSERLERFEVSALTKLARIERKLDTHLGEIEHKVEDTPGRT